MDIHPIDVQEVYTTSDEEKVNEMLRDGWILLDATRGNLKYLFLLARI
jgi:hypothetical protein